MEQWSTFAVVAAGAAAALTGLLCVTVLFVGVLLSIADQSVRVIGAELVALAVITNPQRSRAERRHLDPGS